MAALCANMDFLSPWGQGKIKFPSSFIVKQGFPGNSVGKESACDVGVSGSNPGSGKYPGEGIGYPLQLVYNIVLVSAQHQHESATGIHMSPPS